MSMVRVTWHGARVKALERRAAAAGLRAGMDVMFAGTQADVPRDTGELAASGRVEVNARELRGEIHYGEGLDDPRAVINHEKPEIDHPGGGRAKYVELPMRRLAPQAVSIIAARLRGSLT